MERKWVLILGRVLIFTGIIILVASFVFDYLSSLKETEPGLLSQIDALSLLLPGIILVGFNRVLNKLEEIKEDREFKDMDRHNNTKQIITRDDQLKDYKYVTRK